MTRNKRNRIDHGGEQRAADEYRVTPAQQRVIEHDRQEVYERARRAGMSRRAARQYAGL